MTLPLFPIIQWFDDAGNPLNGGKITSYEPGTTTPKSLYTDSTGNTAHANPVVLDSAGRAQIWMSGGYKLVLKNSLDVLIITLDQVNVGASGSTGSTSTRATASETVNAVSGATVLTATGLWPANSRLIAIYVKVLTGFGTSLGLTGFDVGYAPFQDAYGSNISPALDTVTNIGDNPNEQPTTASATDILITAIGGTFDATGVIQIDLEYEQGSIA